MKSPGRILLIDDDVGVLRLKKELQIRGYEVSVTERGDTGLAQASEHAFDLVITNAKMPGLSGLEIVRELHLLQPRLPIIITTAFATAETAIEATKFGAYDYVLKPFDVPELLELIVKGVACNRLVPDPVEIEAARSRQSAIIGNSRAMQDIYKEIGRVAGNSVTVLIRGETGTGKELIARAIHQHSTRASQPFIAVNCAAIPDTLLESELFGHERGAFTGAHSRRVGRFEQANHGTIFVDEIGDLTLSTQVKLLRVLQEKSIQRVGGNENIPVNVRVLAATHRNLEKALKEGRFREDLFYRLTGVTITLPPLSRRREDVPDLLRCFMQRAACEVGVEALSIQPEAISFFQKQEWPGNVRELENVVRHALLLARNYPISLEHAQEAYNRTRTSVCVSDQTIGAYLAGLLAKAEGGEAVGVHKRMTDELEAELFARSIQLAHGNQAKAARWLGITRTTMREKLLRFGLHRTGELFGAPVLRSSNGFHHGDLSPITGDVRTKR